MRPDWLIKALADPAKGKGKPLEHWHKTLLEPIPQGCRNTTLLSIAGKLLFHDVNLILARDLLLAVNIARCDPPLSVDEVDSVIVSCAKDTSEARPMTCLTNPRYGIAISPKSSGASGEVILKSGSVSSSSSCAASWSMWARSQTWTGSCVRSRPHSNRGRAMNPEIIELAELLQQDGPTPGAEKA